MRYVSPGTNTLVARRSILFDSIQLLYDIPEGSRVVIANVEKGNALEALKQIQALGVNHLHYAPYYPSIEWPGTTYQHVVIFDEAVPPQAADATIINLGVRIADITTCTLVAQHFHILESLREKIEAHFLRANIKLAYSYFEQLGKSRALHKNLQALLNYFEKSILLMDEQGKVLFYNYRARRLLESSDGEVSYNALFLNHYLAGEKDFFIKIDEESYYVEFHSVTGNSTVFITIDDVESIENISNQYKRLLKANGLVAEYSFHDIICNSMEMQSLIKRAQQFAKSDSTICIAGESGCGKELLAQAIHNASKRRKEAFVAVNFAALSATLSEAELFGYVEGAFTGAKKGGEKGLFELSDKGTIFLDEIGDCSSDIQKKILRVIQEKKVMPIGSNKWIPIDIRIISATNQNLSKLVAEKKFRADLYYRLNVLPLTIPPLRERREDILPLFYTFLNDFFNTQVDTVGTELEDLLLTFEWHGNVRELRSVAEYIANCMRADIENWEEEIKRMLFPQEANVEFYEKNDEIIYRIEKTCEVQGCLTVLNQLNMHPYLWTRKSLAQALPYIGENIVKKIILLLNQEGLAISRKGEGTRISTKGKNFLKYTRKKGIFECGES